jgi:hypothetical protein
MMEIMMYLLKLIQMVIMKQMTKVKHSLMEIEIHSMMAKRLMMEKQMRLLIQKVKEIQKLKHFLMEMENYLMKLINLGI